MAGAVRLSDLLARIHDTPGIERIKFITNFPKDMTDDLLEAVRDLPKVCPYLHVPAQSGCNEVLKRMKRLYTVEFYRDMLARCREMVPGVAISSDFIVGFCGETEESFEKTCDLVREAGLQEQLHLQVQPAARHQGARAVCRRRARRGQETPQQRSAGDPERGQPGRTIAARSASGRGAGRGPEQERLQARADRPVQMTGRTPTDHIVVFDGNERLAGQTCRWISMKPARSRCSARW